MKKRISFIKEEIAFLCSKTASKSLPKYTIALFFPKENRRDFPEEAWNRQDFPEEAWNCQDFPKKQVFSKINDIPGFFLCMIEKNRAQRYTVKEYCAQRYPEKEN